MKLESVTAKLEEWGQSQLKLWFLTGWHDQRRECWERRPLKAAV